MCIGATNAAILNLVRSMALELAPDGITVAAVTPGPTDTARWPGLQRAVARTRGVTVDEAKRYLLGKIPLGRVARADEVGDLIAYLASPFASYVTGASFTIDGGLTQAI